MRGILRHIVPFFAAACLFLACSLVDENLDDCGVESSVNYELRLITNISTELNTVLSLNSDIGALEAFRNYFADIFTDYANDVDLSFYDTGEGGARLSHERRRMDGSQSSFPITLQVRNYLHTCVANIDGNSRISLEGDESSTGGRLVLKEYASRADTVSPQKTGLFTARLPISVSSGESQNFDVRLYMVNAATALVLDTSNAAGIRDVKVVTGGFAGSFHVADSLFSFDYSPLVRTDRVDSGNSDELCFAAVHFPSPEAATRTVIDTEDPFISPDSGGSLWEWRCYVTCPDGSVTESILASRKPLRSGQLKVLKAKVSGNGIVTTEDPSVAISVQLDWKKGGNYPIPLGRI